MNYCSCTSFHHPPLLSSVLLPWDSHFLIIICASVQWLALSNSIICLITPPLFGAPLQVWVFLCWDRCFSISVSTPKPGLGHFNFILCSFITFCVLLYSTQYCPSGTPLFQVVAPLVDLNISDCLSKPHFDSQLTNITLHINYISHNKPNDIAIEYHSVARYKSSSNT